MWIMKVVIHWTKVIVINYKRIQLNDSLLQITLLNNVRQEPILAIIMRSDCIFREVNCLRICLTFWKLLVNYILGETKLTKGLRMLSVKRWSQQNALSAWAWALTPYDVDTGELGLRHKQCHTFFYYTLPFMLLLRYSKLGHRTGLFLKDTESLLEGKWEKCWCFEF